MTEKLSPFREAMQEYKGNVSSIQVENITPSGLENLFKGLVLADNVFFKKGDELKFRYYSPSSPSHELILPGSSVSYPILSGVAHVDASTLRKRIPAY